MFCGFQFGEPWVFYWFCEYFVKFQCNDAEKLTFVVFLFRVLSDKTSEGLEPKYTWSKHSLPVTDIHVGCGAIMSRVWSASLDHTVKVIFL